MHNEPAPGELLDAILHVKDLTVAGFGKVDARFDEHDRRFDMIDTRLGRLETRIEGLERRLPA